MLTVSRSHLLRALPALMLAGVLALAPSLAPSGQARANSPADAEAFISDLADRAINELNTDGLSDEDRRARFRELMDEGFDIETLARFVLGRYWRAAEPAEREEFIDTFTRMAMQRFLPVFSEFSDDDFEITDARADSNADGVYLVTTRVQLPNSSEQPEVQWRVRQNDGGFRIIDVVAEGVSMAITLRSEYGSVIQREGGVSGLTAMLNDRIERGDFEADSADELVQ